jgi:uncharacterized repeat protein (TIGR01451 family)
MNYKKLSFSGCQFRRAAMRVACTMTLAFLAAMTATGQATSPAIRLRTIAEVATKTVEDGREVVHLKPADRVVPGDQVLYTLEIRNSGPIAIVSPTVVDPIPLHVVYVADSATGPGAEVSFSVDGGQSFDRPENLRVMGADGRPHLAKPSDYTHIRWKLKKTLKSKSTAFARFRAVVK